MAIHLILGDITTVQADAVVNAANSQLLPGGGVCGAIHAAAGPELARACRTYVAEHGPVAPGGAAMTPGFRLPARFVIHAVGPVWRGGSAGEADTLISAYCSAVELADAQRLQSIAFPSISTGIYGYPVGLAAAVALRSVRDELASAANVLDATFVLFDSATYAAYERALDAAKGATP
jgi:O-acetyl-ADP-ribose deacetylase (regulator of RNase III)